MPQVDHSPGEILPESSSTTRNSRHTPTVGRMAGEPANRRDWFKIPFAFWMLAVSGNERRAIPISRISQLVARSSLLILVKSFESVLNFIVFPTTCWSSSNCARLQSFAIGCTSSVTIVSLKLLLTLVEFR